MTALRIETRRRRVIELRCLGLTIPQISEKLRDEGFRASEKTIWNDLHSSTVEDFVEELKRRQLADIALSEEYKTRLHFRDRLLDKLIPKQIKSELTGPAQIIVNFDKSLEIKPEDEPETS